MKSHRRSHEAARLYLNRFNTLVSVWATIGLTVAVLLCIEHYHARIVVKTESFSDYYIAAIVVATAIWSVVGAWLLYYNAVKKPE